MFLQMNSAISYILNEPKHVVPTSFIGFDDLRNGIYFFLIVTNLLTLVQH